MNGKLYIVATPIGNLGDFSFRGVEILKSATVIAAEDPARSAVLLNRYSIEASMVCYNEGNKETAVPRIIGLLKAGHDVAYISEAGTPCISDPGFYLVRRAIEEAVRGNVSHKQARSPGRGIVRSRRASVSGPTD